MMMLAPENHPEEVKRLIELQQLCILDTAPEERFDRITRLARRLFSVKFALVSLIDAERQWFKSNQGLDVSETPRDISFCGHAILQSQALVVEDASLDVRFADNPLVFGLPGIRFYAGVPLMGPAGYPIGTLCVIDTVPREFGAADVAALRDMADLIEAELGASSLAESRRAALLNQARLTAVIDNIMDGIITTDASGTIQTINRAALRIFEYDSDALIGQNIQQLMPEPYRSAGLDFSNPLIAADLPRFSSETSGLRRGGAVFPMELAISEISCTGYRGMAGIIRDVSEPRRRQRELEDARHNAESANRAKSDFLANMSHEIRTPLNAVLGASYLLSTTALQREQRDYLCMIESAGQALLATLNDILDFSKIEAGQMTLAPTVMSLDNVLAPLATMMSVAAADKDLELVIGVDPGLPSAYVCDPLRLQQVLLNLVSNAIKFTREGEVSLLVDRVAGDAGTATLRFRVRDTGIGISEEQQGRLFQPFTQADTSTTRRFGGTGLGLSISRRLATMMGGDITIQSALGQGSEFCLTLTLPLAAPHANAADSMTPSSPYTGLRVLLASEHATSAHYLGVIVDAWSCRLSRALSTQQAMELMKAASAAGDNYDLVLIDANSAMIDVEALSRRIRNEMSAEGIPLIICMANAFGRGLLAPADSYGIDAFLSKPVVAGSLRCALAEASAGRAGESTMMSSRHRIDGNLLLVEDNPINQLLACRILRRAGAEVDVAANGREALEMLKMRPQRYRMVLMDVQMPVMDGIEATRAIRGELGMDLPILAMTAGVLDTERTQCIEAGMTGVIAKPIDIDEMFGLLLQHLPGNSTVNPAPAAQLRGTGDDGLFDVGDLLSEGDPAGNASMVALIGKILAEAPDTFGAANAARAAGDHASAGLALHSMRGGIGSLGASRFVHASCVAEAALKALELSKLDGLFHLAEVALSESLAAGATWLERYHLDSRPLM